MRIPSLQTLRTLAVAALVAGLVPTATGCTAGGSDGKDWSYGSDETDDAGTDTGSIDCGPGETFDPVSETCEPTSSPDTGVPTHDTGTTDTGSPTDEDTGPPTQPTAGTSFEGPTVIANGDTPVEADHGLALYWKNALVQFGNHALHRHAGDQKIVDLARIQTPTGRQEFRADLPAQPAEKLHFYRNYCEEAGEATCADQGIDDETPTFALAMLGLHEAPTSGDASDCTWRMVYGKQTCDFGRVVAPSRAILLYAYRDFHTSDYPVFDHLDVEPAEVSSGYNLIVLPTDSGEFRVVSFARGLGGIQVSSQLMFRMLYP